MRAEGYLNARRLTAIGGVSLAVWAGVGVACLFRGQVSIPGGRVMSALTSGAASAPEANIVLMQRLPRVLLGLLAGGGLAVAGCIFQALLRNPLATPHTLGVSAGGALGAVVAISLDLPRVALGPVSSVQLFALAGALINVGVIYLLARRRDVFSPLKLLLVGVTLGLISSAMIMFARFIADPNKLVQVDRWLMGGLDVQGYRSLASILPLVLPALAVLLMLAAAMNQLSLGEELAAGRGVDVGAVQAQAFLAGSILTAAIVSVAGPIGFVGLIVPHVLRRILGADQRVLLPACFFGGGAFLAAADAAARSLIPPSELPVGVLTAMLGGPFFLLLLVTTMRRR